MKRWPDAAAVGTVAPWGTEAGAVTAGRRRRCRALIHVWNEHADRFRVRRAVLRPHFAAATAAPFWVRPICSLLCSMRKKEKNASDWLCSMRVACCCCDRPPQLLTQLLLLQMARRLAS